MQILISVVINIIILSISLPLFYIYIVSRVREKLERETMKKAKDEIEALLKEFNNTALTQITTLEDVIIRAKKIVNNVYDEMPQIKEDIKKEKLIILENRTVESEEDVIDIEINDNKEVFEARLEKPNKLDIKVSDENYNNTDIKNNNIPKTEEKINKNTESKNIEYKSKHKETLEKLRHRLDKTIRENLEKKIEPKDLQIENSSNELNDNIIKLYKSGYTKQEIINKLKCTLTEIDIVLSMADIND